MKKKPSMATRYEPGGDLAELGFRWNTPAVDVVELDPPAEVLGLIPAELARRHLAVPLGIVRGMLIVALPDPTDRDVIAKLSEAVGMEVFPNVATRQSLRAALSKFYPV